MTPFWIGFIAFIVGNIVGGASARRKLKTDVKNIIAGIIAQGEQYLGQRVIRVRVEKHADSYFMYEQQAEVGFVNTPARGEVFIAQGKTKYELLTMAKIATGGALLYIEDFKAFEFETGEVH